MSRNGRKVEEFQTGISPMLGGFVMGEREVHVDRIVNALPKRIIDGIRRRSRARPRAVRGSE